MSDQEGTESPERVAFAPPQQIIVTNTDFNRLQHLSGSLESAQNTTLLHYNICLLQESRLECAVRRALPSSGSLQHHRTATFELTCNSHQKVVLEIDFSGTLWVSLYPQPPTCAIVDPLSRDTRKLPLYPLVHISTPYTSIHVNVQSPK